METGLSALPLFARCYRGNLGNARRAALERNRRENLAYLRRLEDRLEEVATRRGTE